MCTSNTTAHQNVSFTSLPIGDVRLLRAIGERAFTSAKPSLPCCVRIVRAAFLGLSGTIVLAFFSRTNLRKNQRAPSSPARGE